jgi:hypothetical protein
MKGIAERVRLMLESHPFKAFTVHTSDGQAVTVRQPNFAWIHPFGRTMYVCPDPAADTEEIIHLLHVTKLTTGTRQSHNRRNK